MPPLVSVIIPTYNSARWIGEALASAATQSWTELEIIVVDDSSSDDTPALVRKFADARVRLVVQGHRGAAAARNRGVRETLGTLVQFLDSDDVLSHDKIELQVRALEGAPRDSVASCAWAHFSGSTETARVNPEPVWTVSDPTEWVVGSLAGRGMMQPGAWLTPRSLIEAAGPWNETLSLHDDGEFFTRVLLRARKNLFVSGAVAYYRGLEGSLSRRRSRSAIESALAVCRLRERHLRMVRDDHASLRALATQYAQFAYEFADAAPDLAAQAVAAIRSIGVRPAPTVGGKLFRVAVTSLGIDFALRLRSARRG